MSKFMKLKRIGWMLLSNWVLLVSLAPCEDKPEGECDYWGRDSCEGDSEWYKKFRENCPATCGLCAPCEDKPEGECDYWGRDSCEGDSEWYKKFRENCPATCGLCDTTTAAPTTTTTTPPTTHTTTPIETTTTTPPTTTTTTIPYDGPCEDKPEGRCESMGRFYCESESENGKKFRENCPAFCGLCDTTTTAPTTTTTTPPTTTTTTPMETTTTTPPTTTTTTPIETTTTTPPTTTTTTIPDDKKTSTNALSLSTTKSSTTVKDTDIAADKTKVKGSITFSTWTWSDDLSNSTSIAFTNKSDSFCNAIKELPQAGACKVTAFREGSVIMDFEVWPATGYSAKDLLTAMKQKSSVGGFLNETSINFNATVSGMPACPSTLRWGDDCSKKCFCKFQNPCDKDSGRCPEGCIKGFTGPTCSVPIKKDESPEEFTNEEIVTFVVPAVAGVIILTIIIILIVLKKRGVIGGGYSGDTDALTASDTGSEFMDSKA